MNSFNKGGFALLEMVIVSTIIAILVAGALAGYREYQKKKYFVIAVHQLYSDIRKVQNMSLGGIKVTGQCEANNQCRGYGIFFDEANPYSYKIYADIPSAGDRHYQAADDIIIEEVELPKDVYIADLLATVSCGATGIGELHILFSPPGPTVYINNCTQDASANPLYGMIQLGSPVAVQGGVVLKGNLIEMMPSVFLKY